MDITDRLRGTRLEPSAHAIARTGLPAVELIPRPDLTPPGSVSLLQLDSGALLQLQRC